MPLKPRSRNRSSPRIRFMCANRISTFLRSRRDCWKASVLASARTRSRTSSLRSRVILRATAGALGLQRADRAGVLGSPVIDDVGLIDVAGAGQLRATWADIDIALPVEDKVGSTEGTVSPRRLVPHRNVRGDLTIHQPLEQPDRAINTVACEPLGPKIEAAADALHHRLSDGNFRYAVGPRAFGVEDDPEL